MTLPVIVNPGDSGHIAHHDQVHTLLQRLKDQSKFLATGVLQDLLANTPAAGASNLGLLRYVTDVPRLDYSDGSAWRTLVSTSTANKFTAIQNFSADVYFGSGRPWVDVCNTDFAGGAAGDGVADDQPAFAAARAALPAAGGTIFVPPAKPNGFYRMATTFAIDRDYIRLVGASVGSSIIQSGTANVITLGTVSTISFFEMEHVQVRSTSGGGHVIWQAFGTSQCTLFDVFIRQDNAAKSAWDNNAGLFIDNVFLKIRCDINQNASVPGWNLTAPTGNINENLWMGGRYTGGTAYMFHIEGTDSSAWQYHNRFYGLNFENPRGGCVEGLTVDGLAIENCSVDDLTVSTNHMFRFDNSPSSALPSRGVILSGIRRAGGTLGAGLFDIRISANMKEITIISPRNAGGVPFAIDLQGSPCFMIYDSSPPAPNIVNTAKLTSIEFDGTVTISSGALVTGRKLFPGTDANTVQTANGIYMCTTGPPNNANGNNGDFAFYALGGPGQRLWFKSANVWAGIL